MRPSPSTSRRQSASSSPSGTPGMHSTSSSPSGTPRRRRSIAQSQTRPAPYPTLATPSTSAESLSADDVSSISSAPISPSPSTTDHSAHRSIYERKKVSVDRKIANDIKNHAWRALTKFAGSKRAMELVQGHSMNGTHNGLLMINDVHEDFDYLRGYLEPHV